MSTKTDNPQQSSMRLSDFIRQNHPSIISEWESFAATLTENKSAATLRDHAKQILDAVAADNDYG